MKSQDGEPGLPGATRLSPAPLPLEWMDPMSWRLPSGKALAEFALQSGFLAPLLMSGPMGDGRVKRKKKPQELSAEVPVSSGRFRRHAVTGAVTHTRQG
jgi:hypothetical protein